MRLAPAEDMVLVRDDAQHRVVTLPERMQKSRRAHERLGRTAEGCWVP